MATDTASTAVLKRAFARERPFVHFQNPHANSGSDENASFPSGHTSTTFSAVFASARACRLLQCGHERRIWLIGLPLASVTGYLRIAADKHYATDVLAGAGLGAALGWFTPQVYAALVGEGPRPTVQPIVGQSKFGAMAEWVW